MHYQTVWKPGPRLVGTGIGDTREELTMPLQEQRATFQERFDQFIGTLQRLESENNRSEPGYEARYSIRTESIKAARAAQAHVAVYRCAEYRLSGYDETLHREGKCSKLGDGRGRIFCFVDRLSGNVLRPSDSKRIKRDLPSGEVLGNIFDEHNGLGEVQKECKRYSERDHSNLRDGVEWNLKALRHNHGGNLENAKLVFKSSLL